MDDEIELVSDGDGLAVIGDSKAVDLFLKAEGIESRPFELSSILPSLGSAAAAVQAGSMIAANAGRWVRVTEQSAHLMKHSRMMTGSAPGLNRAILTTKGGKITGIIEIVRHPVSMLANPAVLAGVGGLMSQLAMQQQMDEIGEYLTVIDKKVDDILRAQKDATLADMIAVGMVVDEAMTLRGQVGGVSEVTWSKVQATTLALARTQAYALRQLDALAEKLEHEGDVDKLAAASKEAQRTVQEWLVVLARCVQLQDAVGVLELDRVMNTAPDELDRHRVGLQTARRNRLESMSRTTMQLLGRMDTAAELTNYEILLNPINSRALVEGINDAGTAVVRFHEVLGVIGDRQQLEAKRWLDAAGETRDRMLETGADGVEVVRKFGSESVDRARTGAGKVAGGVSDWLHRKRGEQDDKD